MPTQEIARWSSPAGRAQSSAVIKSYCSKTQRALVLQNASFEESELQPLGLKADWCLCWSVAGGAAPCERLEVGFPTKSRLP